MQEPAGQLGQRSPGEDGNIHTFFHQETALGYLCLAACCRPTQFVKSGSATRPPV